MRWDINVGGWFGSSPSNTGVVAGAGVCSGEALTDESSLASVLCVARLRRLPNSSKSKVRGLKGLVYSGAGVILPAVLYAVGCVSVLRFSSVNCRLEKTSFSSFRSKGLIVEISRRSS